MSKTDKNPWLVAAFCAVSDTVKILVFFCFCFLYIDSVCVLSVCVCLSVCSSGYRTWNSCYAGDKCLSFLSQPQILVSKHHTLL